jgi:arginine decarboxylase-like protein
MVSASMSVTKPHLYSEPTERWTPQDASELYDVASWGKGYFSVGDNGHVWCIPKRIRRAPSI